MRFDDATMLLCQGKKIRRQKWSEGVYLILNLGTGVISQNVGINGETKIESKTNTDKSFSLDDVISTDWEVTE